MSHRRSRVFPPINGHQTSYQKGNLRPGQPQRLFFGGLGDISFPREKKCPPEERTSEVQSANMKTNRRYQPKQTHIEVNYARRII